MGDRGIIAIHRTEFFTLDEAKDLLPVVRRITQDFREKTELLMSRLDRLNAESTQEMQGLEIQVQELIKAWHVKIKKLGGQPKGLWFVDFDSGDGYFCWKYPEPDILYWHGYEEGFTNRKPIM